MNAKKGHFNRWLYAIPVTILLTGALISILLCKNSGVTKYPAMITGAYDQEQHHLSVPGSREIKLARSGAYGIYYEYNPSASEASRPEMPPAIECSLALKSTGAQLEAAPDYVETNRYWSKDQDRTGVLIMSVTVDRPGDYTFACRYQDGSTEPEIVVALGPNYVWEFLSVVGKIGLPLFGAILTLCGSTLIASIAILIVAIKRASM